MSGYCIYLLIRAICAGVKFWTRWVRSFCWNVEVRLGRSEDEHNKCLFDVRYVESSHQSCCEICSSCSLTFHLFTNRSSSLSVTARALSRISINQSSQGSTSCCTTKTHSSQSPLPRGHCAEDHVVALNVFLTATVCDNDLILGAQPEIVQRF